VTKPNTFGELKKSGYRPRSVRDELRANLRTALSRGENPFEGIHGYERTVLPALHNAVLSRHDLLLLGLRGQAKTRLLRMLVNLLDPAIPALAGSELNEDPFHPITKYGRRIVAEMGDEAPIAWIPRDERYREKLATPDVTIADLIGDIDPIKAATERRSYSDEEVIHYGIVPRTNRGIFAINELPDLQPRIQVGLLNILEERDLQIRGFPVRIPLDILLVFSANPEDYTNRGNIITPLKDRISSQILTHYPDDVKTAARITAQEAWLDRAFAGSKAGWNIVAQQTLMARLDRKPGDGLRVWTDGWDGYPAARRKLLESIAARRLANPVVIGGDVHMNWVADLKPDYDDPKSPVVASEFCGTSITSQGAAQEMVNALLPENPHMKYARSDRRGYVRASIAGGRLVAELVGLETVKKPDSRAEVLARFAVEDGRPGPQRL